MSWAAALAERRGYFFLALGVLAIDQVTKWAAHAYLAPRGIVEVIPGLFNLDYSRNPGGLFGYFRELEGPLHTLLLSVMPLVAVALILGYLLRGSDTDRRTRLGLALILGGAVGNLVDRLARGEVIDFLDVYVSHAGTAEWFVARFGTAHWPTFNVADSGIVCGAFLLLWTIVRPPGPASSKGDS